MCRRDENFRAPSALQENQPGPSAHLPSFSMSGMYLFKIRCDIYLHFMLIMSFFIGNLWQQLDMEVARKRTSTSFVADVMMKYRDTC